MSTISITGTTTGPLTADLDALAFTPTVGQVPVGQAVTTRFTIMVGDTAARTASDATTSVVAAASVPLPTRPKLTATEQCQ